MRVQEPGLIFVSHSSSDKDFVQEVIKKIPKSHVFYDIRTLMPGAHAVQALQDAVAEASVFALFVSPSTPGSCWVEYETALARAQKVTRKELRILICPIKGASYKDAPQWMRVYHAMPSGYTVSDVARAIKHAYEDALRDMGCIKRSLFVGRERLLENVVVDCRTRPTETGVPVNFLIFAGIENMGRTSVAREIMPKIFPGARLDGPSFDLPHQADSVDLFLALRQDIEGAMPPDRMQELIEAFPRDDPEKQAELIYANLSHYADVNQTVQIRSAFGLRDRGRESKPWMKLLFRRLEASPDLRIVWISQRLLDPTALPEHPNVLQYAIDELDHNAMLFLLTELLDPRATSPAALKSLARKLNGHPATAHYIARLVIDGRRSLETVLTQTEVIETFQDRFLQHLLMPGVLDETALNILSLLAHLPSIDFAVFREIFREVDEKTLSVSLGDLTDSCLVTYSMQSGYKVPEIVRSSLIHKNVQAPYILLERASDVLGRLLTAGDVSLSVIDALIFLSVMLKGHIPPNFRKIITGSVLYDLVDQQYQMGMKFDEGWRKHFELAAKLAELVDLVPASLDACEAILFNGADSLVRMGNNPAPLVDKMQTRGFMSAQYVLGSYFYHQKRDLEKAKVHFRRAQRARAFTKRTARTLAKIYLQEGNARAALDTLDALGESRVKRDSGLLAQKIRCLNATGNRGEAQALMGVLKTLDDDYGEYDSLRAAESLRTGKHAEALGAIERAKSRPKANRINLILLETAIRIDAGD